jgi:hypothetical protein
MQNRSFSSIFFGCLGLSFALTLYACRQQEPSAPWQALETAPSKTEAPQDAAPRAADAESGPAAPSASRAPGEVLFSSSAAATGLQDSLRRLVRKANARFRVQNTLEASLRVEDIVAANGGFVLENHLESEVLSQSQLRVSRDSLLETTRYQMVSHITLRVPVQRLDSTLRQIGRLAQWVNYRHVSAEDIQLQYLEQELSRLRQQTLQRDISSAIGGNSKATDRLEGAALSDQARAAQDAARIQMLQLEDALRYSTLQLDLYQLPQQALAHLAAPPPPRAYTTPLSTRAAAALGAGWRLLETVFLLILQLWGVILIGGVCIWYFYKRQNFIFKPKLKNTQPGAA